MIEGSRTQPGAYRIAEMHVVHADSAAQAESLFLAQHPGAALLDEATALLATADGTPLDVPEICGHEHVGSPVLYYDGAFKTEVLVSS